MNNESSRVLDLLNIWLEQYHRFIEERGVKADLVLCQPTEKTARYIDFDSETRIARAIFWESGELELEALEVDSGRQVIVEHHHANDAETLFSILNRFLEQIS